MSYLCQVCGQKALEKCSQCQTAMYCGQQCANVDWEHGGHEQVCCSLDDLHGDALKLARRLFMESAMPTTELTEKAVADELVDSLLLEHCAEQFFTQNPHMIDAYLEIHTDGASGEEALVGAPLDASGNEDMDRLSTELAVIRAEALVWLESVHLRDSIAYPAMYAPDAIGAEFGQRSAHWHQEQALLENAFTDKLSAAWDAVKRGAGKAWDAAKAAGRKVAAGAKSAASKVAAGARKAADKAKELAGKAGTKLKAFASRAKKSIVQGARKAKASLQARGQALSRAVRTKTRGLARSFKTKMSNRRIRQQGKRNVKTQKILRKDALRRSSSSSSLLRSTGGGGGGSGGGGGGGSSDASSSSSSGSDDRSSSSSSSGGEEDESPRMSRSQRRREANEAKKAERARRAQEKRQRAEEKAAQRQADQQRRADEQAAQQEAEEEARLQQEEQEQAAAERAARRSASQARLNELEANRRALQQRRQELEEERQAAAVATTRYTPMAPYQSPGTTTTTYPTSYGGGGFVPAPAPAPTPIVVVQPSAAPPAAAAPSQPASTKPARSRRDQLNQEALDFVKQEKEWAGQVELLTREVAKAAKKEQDIQKRFNTPGASQDDFADWRVELEEAQRQSGVQKQRLKDARLNMAAAKSNYEQRNRELERLEQVRGTIFWK